MRCISKKNIGTKNIIIRNEKITFEIIIKLILFQKFRNGSDIEIKVISNYASKQKNKISPETTLQFFKLYLNKSLKISHLPCFYPIFVYNQTS